MIWSVVRRSRKPRACDNCRKSIDVGDLYRSSVTHPQPYGDLGNAHWWRLAECAECAQRYGRSVELGASEILT